MIYIGLEVYVQRHTKFFDALPLMRSGEEFLKRILVNLYCTKIIKLTYVIQINKSMFPIKNGMKNVNISYIG